MLSYYSSFSSSLFNRYWFIIYFIFLIGLKVRNAESKSHINPNVEFSKKELILNNNRLNNDSTHWTSLYATEAYTVNIFSKLDLIKK